MVDGVERAGQVRVENPHPGAATGQGVEQRLDRVVAAATRPKPIRSGLEPGLPLRLQRLTDPCLVAPVHDHWDAERPLLGLVMSFRDIHPLDRDGLPRAAGGVHLHRHLGPGLGGQRDPPIDPRGRTTRVALRHLPHADQRVRPAPQHQLLQVPGLGQVPVPHRLEDPAPQPPYPLLMHPPVHLLPGVSVEHTRRVLRSVHRGVQHALRFRHPRPLRRQRLTCPRQHPIRGSGHQARYPAGYPTTIQEKDLVMRSSVSRCLSTTGIRFLGTLSRREFRPDYSRPTTTAHAYLRTRCGPRRGFTTFHTRETQTGPGALFTPGMTVFAGHRVVRGRRPPPHNGRSLPPRHCFPTRDVDVTRHQQEFPDSRPIPVLPLACDRHGWDNGPWAFPWASHPTDQEPATHATVGTRSNTNPELRLRHPSNLLHELTHNVRLRVAKTVVNDPYDLGCQRRLHNLPELQAKARAANRRTARY